MDVIYITTQLSSISLSKCSI